MAYNVSYTTLPTFSDNSIGKVWSYGPYGVDTSVPFQSNVLVTLKIMATVVATTNNPGYMYFLLSNSTVSSAVDTRAILTGRQSLQRLTPGVYLLSLNVRISGGTGRVMIETGTTIATASATIFDQISSTTIMDATKILSVSVDTYVFISVGNDTNNTTQFVNATVQICRIA